MKGTDYDFPPDWEALSGEEKDRWFKQERARRQAMGQKTRFSRKVKAMYRRESRKVEARNEVIINDGY